MNTKNILQLLIISVFFISCSQTVNYDEEKEYFEEKKSIVYYKGSPYSGVIEKHDKYGELISKDIGIWLLRNHRNRWPNRQPHELRFTVLSERVFSVELIS